MFWILYARFPRASDHHHRSHPASDKYGEFYTAEQVHDIFAPSQGTVNAVRVWLTDFGITSDRISQSANKQWMQFDAKTHEVEKLLQTEYFFFEHVPSGRVSIAADE